jgi:hypothetical protein
MVGSRCRITVPIDCLWRVRVPPLRRHHRLVPGLRQRELGALSHAQPAWYTARGPLVGRASRWCNVRQEKDTATHDNRVRSHILFWSILCAFVTSFSFSAYSLLLPAFIQEFHWARSEAALPFSLAMVVWGVM